jgi:hypothetical protein
MKIKLSAAILGMMAAAILNGLGNSGSTGQNPQWKGKIETVDGARVVLNPNAPVYGEIKLELQEDLKIGRADDENYLFYRLRGIDVDKEGNIYVADMSNYRIQKFDKTGKYLLTFGRKGQGPGEFDLPLNVHLDQSTRNVLVQDQVYTIESFSPDGQPIRSVRLEQGFQDFRVAPDGTILALMMTSSGAQATHLLVKVSPEGKVVQTFAEALYTMYIERRGESTISSTSGQELAIQFNILDDRSFVFGYSKDYELTVMDFSGKVLCRIKKDEPYPKFTAKEKARYKRIAYPEFKPYFYGVFTDDLGRIYVQRNKTWAEEENIQKEIDVFSKDGIFLYKTKLPKHTFIIRNGYVYALEANDEEVIKRYKIKNWDSIKSGL